MRVAVASFGLFLFSTAAYAQGSPCASAADTYDPYRPSHLAIMREYAGTMLAQAPLSTLLKLDPYVPSQAELLRQAGRGIPLWVASPWYSYPLPHPYTPPTAAPDCGPAPEPSSESAAAPLTSFSDMWAELQRERATGATAAAAPARGEPSPDRNRGVWIQYDGRPWVSAGAAVSYRDSEFVRIGESAGFAVFRRSGAKDDVIYIPTTPDMVAPFRALR